MKKATKKRKTIAGGVKAVAGKILGPAALASSRFPPRKKSPPSSPFAPTPLAERESSRLAELVTATGGSFLAAHPSNGLSPRNGTADSEIERRDPFSVFCEMIKPKRMDHLGSVKKAANQIRYLKAYSACGTHLQACERTGLSVNAHNNWMEEDEKYREAVKIAVRFHNERLEAEALRRGVAGIDDVVYANGVPVGVKKVYSDTLLIFMMKGAMPDKYKERTVTEHTGKVEVFAFEEDENL